MNRTEKLGKKLSTEESLNNLRKRISKKECPICQASFKDPVKMTCKASHEFCFSCIIQWVSTKGSLESCPLCRGGDKFIIMGDNPTRKEYSYNSLNHFLLSKKILQKVLFIKNNENTCLIPERLLLTYVKNKDQIELALGSRMSSDKLIKLINWDIPVSDDCCSICSYTQRNRPRLTNALSLRREINGELLIRDELIRTSIPGPPSGSPPRSPLPRPPLEDPPN
jgi:hypothetical protein